eukprot:tig00000073_g1750.t1
MESEDLLLNLPHIAAYGYTLTDHERATLESSLMLLKLEHNFDRVHFWGKVMTTGPVDYIVAQGFPKILRLQDKNVRTSFYSANGGMSFKPLPAVDQVTKDRVEQLTNLFCGDPLFEYMGKDPPPPPPPEPEEEEGAEPKEEAAEPEPPASPSRGSSRREYKITEEQRLATLVEQIDLECSIVPRGAIALSVTHYAAFNKKFEGLSIGEKPSFDKDFFPPISKDVPKGCWSVQFEPLTQVATLRNFLWPGFLFYHMAGTRNFGHVYFGYGEKNLDFGFMM